MSKSQMIVQMLTDRGLDQNRAELFGQLYDEVESVIESRDKKYVSVEMIKRRTLKDVLERVFDCNVDQLRRERKVRSLEQRLNDMSDTERQELLKKYMK
ncbi:MAG: hypothetical protein BWZ04_03098 [Firmicutes bacterium ADurb.BinA205]|nr:MAG: hypothetical protein BWZ04_03098 [Firmicutes bacterium ADurb.BinA205]